MLDKGWYKDALCVRADPELPYGDDNDPEEPYSTADAHQFAEDYCQLCPVMFECALYGADQRYGVWGGQVRANYKPAEDS